MRSDSSLMTRRDEYLETSAEVELLIDESMRQISKLC